MNYFAKPYTKPTTGTAAKRKPKIKILWRGGLKTVNGVKRLRESAVNIEDSRGTTYDIGLDGVLRRDPPKVRMSKKARLKLRREMKTAA